MRKPSLIAALVLTLCGCQEVMPKWRASLRNAKEGWTQYRISAASRDAGRHLDLGDIEGARRSLEHAVASGASDPPIYLLLAQIEMDGGRFANAREWIEKAARLWPDRSDIDGARGLLEECQGNWQAAHASYTAQAEKTRGAVPPVLALARVLHAMGRAEKAARLLARAAERHRRSAPLLRAAGEAALATGDPNRAAEYLEQALVLKYDDHAAPLLLAISLHVAGRHEEAYHTLVELSNEFDTPQLRLALARSALMALKLDAAVDNFEEYLRTHPDDAETLLDLARALVLGQQQDKASEAIGRAITIRPDFIDAFVLRGHVQNQAGRRVEAASSYLEAVRLGADTSLLSPLMETLHGQATKR